MRVLGSRYRHASAVLVALTGPAPDLFAGLHLRLREAHGVGVHLTGDDPGMLSQASAILQHFGLTPVGREVVADPLRVHLTCGAPSTAPASGAREIARQAGIRALAAADRVWLVAEDQCIRLDPESGEAEVMFSRALSELRKDMLIYGALFLLRGRRLFGLHASAIARGGEGLLLVAESGSGKSTTTYALVRSGWSYLADDAVLLQADRQHVKAIALRRDLGLHPSLISHFPEVAALGDLAAYADRGKLRLDMRTCFPDRLVDRCIPRALVFPEIVDEADSRLIPLEAAGALPMLAAQSVLVGLEAAMPAGHMATLVRLAHQAESYRLLLGRDLQAHPERTAQLLDELPLRGPVPLPT